MTVQLEHRLSVRSGRPREPIAEVPIRPAAGGSALHAAAPSLRQLFEEAAGAVIRLRTRPETIGPACRWEAVALGAGDPSSLATLWLARLVDLGDSRRSDRRPESVVAAMVDRVGSPEDDPMTGRWTLRARVGLRPCFAGGPAASGLPAAVDLTAAVERRERAWTLSAEARV